MASGTFISRLHASFGVYKNVFPRLISTTSQANSKVSEVTKKLEDLKIPERPKRPLTPFFRYLNEFRPIVKKEHPDWKNTQVTQQCGKDWKTCDQKMKETYHKEFQKESSDYKQVYKDYVKNLTKEQLETIKNVRKEIKEIKEKASFKKLNNQLGKPKRPAGPYFYFIKEKQQLPSNAKRRLADLMLDCRGEWKNLSELEKDKYNKIRSEAFDHYNQEIEKWEAKMIKQGHVDVVRKSSQLITGKKSSKKSGH